MQRNLDRELAGVKELLLEMGSLAERMINRSINDLVERRQPSGETPADEAAVNDLQIKIDEKAIQLIALHNPVADDLRFLVMATRIAGELERLADQAVNIAQNTSFLVAQPLLKPLVDIPIMADIARRMVIDSLDAFTRRDAGLARKVLDTDDKVDAFKDQIFRELLTYMMSDPSSIQRALALILISRNLERIGDHATNIAEEVIYLVEGRDVRHHHEERVRSPGSRQ